MTQQKSDEEVVEQAPEEVTEPTTEEEVAEAVEDKSEWQLKAEEHLADLQRTQADFENYRKRQQESQRELGGYLIEKLILVEVVLDFVLFCQLVLRLD